MLAQLTRTRLPPLALGVAMLGVVIASIVLPNTGAVPAQSSCPYGNCTTEAPGLPPWAWAVIAAVVLVALTAGVLLLMARRRRGGGPAGPPEEGGGPGAYPEEPGGEVGAAEVGGAAGPELGAGEVEAVAEEAPPLPPAGEAPVDEYAPPAWTEPPPEEPEAAVPGAGAESANHFDRLLKDLNEQLESINHERAAAPPVVAPVAPAVPEPAPEAEAGAKAPARRKAPPKPKALEEQLRELEDLSKEQ